MCVSCRVVVTARATGARRAIRIERCMVHCEGAACAIHTSFDTEARHRSLRASWWVPFDTEERHRSLRASWWISVRGQYAGFVRFQRLVSRREVGGTHVYRCGRHAAFFRRDVITLDYCQVGPGAEILGGCFSHRALVSRQRHKRVVPQSGALVLVQNRSYRQQPPRPDLLCAGMRPRARCYLR